MRSIWITSPAKSLPNKAKVCVATRFARGTEDATAGYGVVDIGATWRFAPQQSLRFAIRNVGDKRYHEHLAEGLPGMEVKAPGRSFGVSWEGKF